MIDIAGIGLELRPTLPHWSETLPDSLKQSFFEFSETDASGSKIAFHGCNHVRRREQPVERNNRRVVRIFWRIDRRGIRDNTHDFLPQRLFRKKQLDRIAVAFAHLLPVQPENSGDLLADARLR